MRIAVLAHNLHTAGGLTVGRNVAAALRQVADRHEYFLTLPSGAGYESLELPTRTTTYLQRRSKSGARQVLFNLTRLAGLIRAQNPDVVWGLGNFGVENPGCPQAFLCMDANLVAVPDGRRPRRPMWSMYRWYGARRIQRALPYTQLVFCQTQTMLSRFRERFGYRGELALMPNAVSPHVEGQHPARPAALAGLADRFVLLCPSRHYPHKNLESLIALFRTHGGSLADVTVVLTVDAGQDAAAGRFVRAIGAADIRRYFLNIGSLPQSELSAYFGHVQGMLLPTLLESFSAAYLEAMQFGTPILTSDMDFAREVCGDAAVYFDPRNMDSIRDAILRLKHEPGLSDSLIECGRRLLAGRFRSWNDIVSDAVGRLERLVRTEGR